MTDHEIAAVFGWPSANLRRDSSLMHRLRIVAAAAESAAHAECAERIAEQAAQIERMRAALAAAREICAIDRDAFAECCRSPVEPHYDDNDAAYLAGMDAVLRQIDEAMGEPS